MGIDLGTTNSLVATLKSGVPTVLSDAEGRLLLPSVVQFAEDGVVRVGAEAVARAAADPRNTIASAKRLEKGGATAILICANSMHKVYDQIVAAVTIPVIHIADAVGQKMKADGIKSAALVGTRNVMAESWYRQRLVKHGVSLLPAEADDAVVFHAGTQLKDGVVSVTGGRVLCVTVLADSVKQAQQRAYDVARGIHFEGAQYRRDIGYRAIKN
mgnify:CR=1 FL=1